MVSAELNQVARLHHVDRIVHPIRYSAQALGADRHLLSVAIGAETEQSNRGIRADPRTQRVGAREAGIECAGKALFTVAAVAHAAFGERLDTGGDDDPAVDIEGADHGILAGGYVPRREISR